MPEPTKSVTKWAHLPNAGSIDRIIAHIKANPDGWDAAWDAAGDAAGEVARAAARAAAREAAREAAGEAAGDAARDAAWDAAWDAARDAAWAAAWDAAWDAIAALIAWDDVAPILDMSEDEARVLSMMGMHAPVLLLPAVIALNTNN